MRSFPIRPSRAAFLEALPVAAIVAVAGLGAAIFAVQLSEFTIMPDELAYLKQAVALSHGDVPTPGSFWFNSWALLYPLMLAPVVRVFSVPTAFDVGRVIGAFVLASTAIPVYLIARRILTWRPAMLMAAALSVAVPWMALSAAVMTEVLAYPVFAWTCLAMLAGLSRPGLRGDVVVGAALVVAFFTRTQLLALAPAYVLALAIDVAFQREATPRERARAALRAHAPTVAVVLVGTAAVVATGWTRRLLGSYSEPTHGALLPPGTSVAARELTAYIVIGAGALPLALAAAWALVTLGRRVTRDRHAFAALLVSVVAVLTLVGASFTVRYAHGINDRYLFYVLPLLFVGAMAALERSPRGFVAALAATGALTVWLLAAAAIRQEGPSLIAPSMASHTWLHQRADELGTTLPHLAAIAAAVLIVATIAAHVLLRPHRVQLLVGVTLLVWAVTETAYTYDKVAATQRGVSPEFLSQRGWVDRALPKNGRAIAVLASLGDPGATAATWWDTLFWNKSVDRVTTLGGGTSFEQPSRQLISVDRETGRVPELDRYQYVVRYANDARFGLRGSQTVANAGAILVLRAARPYKADWLFEGPDPDAAVVPPGTSAKVRGFASAAAASKLAITLATTGPRDVQLTVASGQRRKRAKIPRDGRATLVVPAHFRRGHADAELRVAPGAAGVALIDVVAS